MPSTPESLLLKLDIAARLLDQAAGDLRDLGLSPLQKGRPSRIECIGLALSQIYEIQGGVYEQRPDLQPAWLDAPSPFPEANKRMTTCMFEASELEREGDLASAIEKFRDLLGIETEALHRDITLREIARQERSE
jgi:hypothetical protein